MSSADVHSKVRSVQCPCSVAKFPRKPALLISIATKNSGKMRSTPDDTVVKNLNKSYVVEMVTMLKSTNLAEALHSKLKDTRTATASLMTALSDLLTHSPCLYVDLEGMSLSRHGSISILQTHVLSTNETYLVDVHVLKNEAFSTSVSNWHTLKSIFESGAIPKALFDIGNGSDSFHSLYGIEVAGIWVIYLMELASRSSSKRYINVLAKCSEKHLPNDRQRGSHMGIV
jgi:hypothetical protein